MGGKGGGGAKAGYRDWLVTSSPGGRAQRLPYKLNGGQPWHARGGARRYGCSAKGASASRLACSGGEAQLRRASRRGRGVGRGLRGEELQGWSV